MRTLVRVSLILALIAVVTVLAGFLYLREQYRSPGPLQAEKAVVIERGMSVAGIADLLRREGIIESPRVFRLGLRYENIYHSLKAGEFAFPPRVSMQQAGAVIAFGKPVIRRLTIAEGLTTNQVLQAVRAADGLTGDVSDGVAAEGALLPETYFYSWGDSRMGLVNRMRTAMKETVMRLWPKRRPSIRLERPEDAVILASIIEKETGVDGERARISSVFHNRLRLGMRLQSDPTVVYAIAGGEGALGRALTRADLAVDSPYNTYSAFGLPPGPIANPGVASIEAALNPGDGDELYFVADGTGGHAFAKTLAGHNRNVARYRRFLRQQETGR